jgi:hypothetical protein
MSAFAQSDRAADMRDRSTNIGRRGARMMFQHAGESLLLRNAARSRAVPGFGSTRLLRLPSCLPKSERP